MARKTRARRPDGEAQAERHGYLRFELPDMHGISRSKTVPIDKVEGYASRGLNFYGGILGLDTSSNVVPASAMHSSATTPTSCSSPTRFASAIPWLENTAASSASATSTRRAAARRPALGLLRARREANALGYDVVTATNTSTTCCGGDAGAPLRGHPHLPHGPQPVRAVPRPARADAARYGIDVITHNCEYAGSQFETVYGPGLNLGRPRQGVCLQERHEGARPPQRSDRQLHGQALCRPCPAAAATSTLACAARVRAERLLRCRGRARRLDARRLLHRGHPRPRTGDDAADQPHA